VPAPPGFGLLRSGRDAKLIVVPLCSREMLIRILAAAFALLLAAGWLVWCCEHRPEISFLPARKGAEWIVYPCPPNSKMHHATEWSASFHRSLTLAAAPTGAVVSVRAFKDCIVFVNGHQVGWSDPPTKNWKQIREEEVSGFLHAGTNDIDVTVMNREGPPALWLILEAGELRVGTDTAWRTSLAGAEWRAASLARARRLVRPGNELAGGERTFAALAAVWPLLMLWAALGTTASAGWFLWQAKRSAGRTPVRIAFRANLDTILLAVIIGLWILLFWHNLLLLPRRSIGFDASDHLKYIQYIQQHRRLPLPDEGFQMFQPPLFYIIGAATLAGFDLSAADPGGVLVLHVLTLLCGIAQVICVFLGARMLFADSPSKKAICLLLAGFLPMLLYLSHYLTNETLAAAFATGAIVLAQRMLLLPRPSLICSAGIGLCFGAAVLTKVTAVLIAPALFGALAARSATQRQPAAVWLRTLGVAVATAVLACGWHYLRVWARFGTPLVFSWDAAAGFSWWQEDGYRTSAFFTRFGQGLASPSFAGFNSFLDGMYSTLWGDGLCGGEASLESRPPWNGNLVAVGYLLALMPTALILLGGMVSCWRWLRRPTAGGFLLLGVAATFAGALVFNCLEVPYLASVKAFYALPALVPLCVFGATGYDWLARKSRVSRFLLGALLMVWAVNSLASLWIRAGSSQTHLYLGLQEAARGQVSEALERLSRAAKESPTDVQLARAVGSLLVRRGAYDEARQWAEQSLRTHPDDPVCRGQLAAALAQQGNRERAIAEFQRLMNETPDDPEPYLAASYWLAKENRFAEALEIARRGLAVAPAHPYLQELTGVVLYRQSRSVEAEPFLRRAVAFGNDSPKVYLELAQALVQQGRLAEAAELVSKVLKMPHANAVIHHQLAVMLLQLGRAEEAVTQFRAALQLNPDDPYILNDFAWLRATHPDLNLRNGQEAVALAGHACTLTGNKVALLVGTLAAAYAEAGRFEEAADAARRAISLAQDSGETSIAAKNEAWLKLYQRRLPYHQTRPVVR